MLPSGLASISSRLDDSPQVRGAVDMARRIRRAEALGCECGITCEEVGEPEQAAIDRHAALAIGSAYRAQDRR